ncbi:copper resistance CopC family protein [Microbacterium xylanilyticum]
MKGTMAGGGDSVTSLISESHASPRAHSARRQWPRRVIAGGTATLLGVALAMSAALPAAAEDGLESSTPAAGTTIDVAPAEISLTFTGLMHALDSNIVVEVTDAAGQELADGNPRIQDRTVIQPVRKTSSTGAFTVRWRIMGRDGKTVTDSFSYDVTAATNTVPAADESPTPAPEPDDVPYQEAPPREDLGQIGVLTVLGFGAILGASAGVVMYAGWQRRKRDRAEQVDTDAPAEAQQ